MVIKRSRWKVFFNDKKETKGVKAEWYGLKSSLTPKQVRHFFDIKEFYQSITEDLLRSTLIFNGEDTLLLVMTKQLLARKEIFTFQWSKFSKETVGYLTLCEKCPYLEFFWTIFSRVLTEYGEILRIPPHSFRMRKKTDQRNFKYRHFSRSVILQWERSRFTLLTTKFIL